jgi:hypothetical protein
MESTNCAEETTILTEIWKPCGGNLKPWMRQWKLKIEPARKAEIGTKSTGNLAFKSIYMQGKWKETPCMENAEETGNPTIWK